MKNETRIKLLESLVELLVGAQTVTSVRVAQMALEGFAHRWESNALASSETSDEEIAAFRVEIARLQQALLQQLKQAAPI
ncbi:hypothetical protein [Delftia acidovorans]|uniref:hypothetical protein n=1 Tax=Delftia acidovorans TaxID=80866 RepID=UPI00286EF5E8|nr:hypothetical protein [Delftia acidovorans]